MRLRQLLSQLAQRLRRPEVQDVSVQPSLGLYLQQRSCLYVSSESCNAVAIPLITNHIQLPE